VPPRILLIQQEWPTDFRRSSQWSYISSLGYVEALRACGANVTLMTTPWLAFAPDLLSQGDVDQAWLIDLVHLEMPPWLLACLAELAPVRVGLSGESLTHTLDELRDMPQLAGREALVRSRADAMTHSLFCDEEDARRFAAWGYRALWAPPAMLASLIVPETAVAPDGPVGFIGEVYAKRARLFGSPGVAQRVARVVPNDRTPNVEARYLALHELCLAAETARPKQRRELHAAYNARLLGIRREIFERYLAAFAGLGATINPPSFVKCYPGRVVEAMGRGVPVITARLVDRPGADRMFERDTEILTFAQDDPAELCARIDALRADPCRGRGIALRARERLIADHTLEARCAQILRFIAQFE
jgi:hypothetical protein